MEISDCKRECERYMQGKVKFNSHRFFLGREEYFKFCDNYAKEHPEYIDAYQTISCFYECYVPKTCPVCGKKIPVDHRKDGKDKVCSQECYRTKRGLEIAKERRQKTNEKRYGSIEEANKIAYERHLQTVKEKYGVSNAGLIPNIKEKRMQTMVERYGAKTTLESKELKQKVQKTNLEKYGTISPAANEEVREKIEKTTIERYGSSWGTSEILKKKMVDSRNKNDEEKYFEIYKKNWEAAGFEFIDFKYPTSRHFFKLRCKYCGREVVQYNDTPLRCQVCAPYNISSQEEKIINFIKSLGIKCEHNNREIIKPQELDIVIPDKKIAVEVDGVYWHSEKLKEKNYHLNKTNAAKEKGYKLIHIFDTEVNDNWNIVRARLKNILGKTPYKIYARKCEVREIDNASSMRFINKYHIQGNISSSVRLGLFYKNRMVAVMTFSKPRFNKQYSWELLRYCTLANFNVIGGAGKLLSYFRKHYSGSIISYADKRWSDGNLYRKLGFEELKDSPPNYKYTNGNHLYSRLMFQKHKLKDLLSKFDENLSENENMTMNGYYRVWDCGNKVFVLKEQE